MLCQRPVHVHQGGVWELPGGKVKQGEDSLQALKRELSEEINILVEHGHRLSSVDHDYPDRSIRLEAWVIDGWSGTLNPNEDRPLEWVLITDLDKRQLPAANDRITKLLGLPSLYLITPDLQSYDDGFVTMTQEFIKNGLRFIQFRSKLSTFTEHEQVVRRLVQICEKYSCRLIYNGSVEQVTRLGAHGLHLSSTCLMQLQDRPLPQDQWVVASCHDQLEIEHAAKIGVDFCVLSPVHKSSSHSVDNGMGWHKFNILATKANIPVYALGGIQPGEIVEARSNGAHGVAMISGVWDAPDPVAEIRKLNDE